MQRHRRGFVRPFRPLAAVCCLLAVAAPAALAGDFDQGRELTSMGRVLPPRERIEPVNRMLADRLDNLLPQLMRETGIDFWLVINREYVEDPVYLTLVPEPAFAARRTTMRSSTCCLGSAGS